MNGMQGDDFLRRIAAFQDGGLSEDEMARFDLELQNDKSKRAWFIDVQLRSAAVAEIFREQAVATDDVRTAAPASRNRKWSVACAALAVAGCLAISFLLTPRPTAPPRGSAILTIAQHVHWHGNAPASGVYFEPRVPYQLDAGAVRLRMEGGGIVSMAAPASFTVLDGITLELTSGKLAARLLDDESKLRVRTGDLEIRDLGTAFGITADTEGRVDLAVFDGSVGVRGRNGTSNLVEFVSPGPDLRLENLAHDHKIFLMPERLNQRMTKPITIDLVAPGHTWPASPSVPSTIGEQEVISSYLLVYKSENSRYRDLRALSGSVSFQQPILGAAVELAHFRKTDNLFGAAGIDYDSFPCRRLEAQTTEQGDLPPDSLRISDDGRQLYFNLFVGAHSDHIRVLVKENN